MVSAWEPSTTTSINGQDAAWAEYTDKDVAYIEAVIARNTWSLLIVAKFQTEKDAEFRLLIEASIRTIEIK